MISSKKSFFSKKALFRFYQNKKKHLFLKKRFKIKILLRLKKEGKNKKLINSEIEYSLNKRIKINVLNFFNSFDNEKIVIENFSSKQILVRVLKNRLNFGYLSFFLKQYIYSLFRRKKQYFYSLFNLIIIFNIFLKNLKNKEIFLFSNFKHIVSENKNILLKVKYLEEIIFMPKLKSLFNLKKRESALSLVWEKNVPFFNLIYFQLYFLYITLNFQKILDFKNIFSILVNKKFNFFLTNLESLIIEEYILKNKMNLNIKTIFQRKELKALFLGRTTSWNIFLKNNPLMAFIFERLLLKNRLFSWKLSKNRRKSAFENEISFGLVYFILRLEEKLKDMSLTDEKTKQSLFLLRNLFLKKIDKKINFNIFKNYFLSNLKSLQEIKMQKKKNLSFFSKINKLNQNKVNFFSKNQEKFNLKNNTFFFKKIKITFLNKKNKKKRKKLIKVALWKEKKLTETRSLIAFKNFPQIFSLLLGVPTSLIFINALTLTKFGFKTKVKGARRFLKRVERDLIQRYKYIAIYIQDFLRVCFFSFFLKKPTFLVNFIGFQIAKLPRNRKETSFIRFIIKFIKIFGAQRREITAIKIEFKGRVNRWRRTKIIRGMRNVISYVKYDSAIEFGSGKAITRKGTLGIRLWLAYKFTEVSNVRKALLSYILYSQIRKTKKISQFLKIFQNKQIKKI